MAHAVETMMYVGEAPWHRLGTKLEEGATIEAAIDAAGLRWTVKAQPLLSVATGHIVSHRAVCRGNEVLGIVGPKFTPLQNHEAFEFFSPFLDAGQATLETAGSLHGGKRVWILAKLALANSVIVKKSDDRVVKYVLLSNSHDGSLALRAGFTPVRAVCDNTLTMAHNNAASALLRIRHTKNIKDTLAKVGEIMNIANQRFEATADELRFLASRNVDSESLQKYVTVVFPAAKSKDLVDELLERTMKRSGRRSTVISDVTELFETGIGNTLPGVRGTWWAAYNAVTEFLTHRRGNDAERRLDSAWFGDGAVRNRRALSTAVAMANAD